MWWIGEVGWKEENGEEDSEGGVYRRRGVLSLFFDLAMGS